MTDNTLNERIGFEMRSQRLLKRMTLEQVANAMGICQAALVPRNRHFFNVLTPL